MSQRHSVALNLRVSPEVRGRLDAQSARFDLTITSLSRLALLVGLEALEALHGVAPAAPIDPGPKG